jgi:hypothetical protein
LRLEIKLEKEEVEVKKEKGKVIHSYLQGREESSDADQKEMAMFLVRKEVENKQSFLLAQFNKTFCRSFRYLSLSS